MKSIFLLGAVGPVMNFELDAAVRNNDRRESAWDGIVNAGFAGLLTNQSGDCKEIFKK